MNSVPSAAALATWGWNETWEKRAQGKDGTPARVIEVHREQYVVHDGSTARQAVLSGHAVYVARSGFDFPTVGDWVLVDHGDTDGVSVIRSLLERTSWLARKTPGRSLDVQLLGANIDVACIVLAADTPVNLGRLDRFVAVARKGGVTPVLVVNKCDAVRPAKLQRVQAAAAEVLGEPPLCIRALDPDGLAPLRAILQPRSTYCLLGQSGVGKTTIVNRLIGEDRYETSPVRRRDHKGRHTTTHRYLVQLPLGALLIDNPGLREVGVVEEDSADPWGDLEHLATQCRFSNCSHLVEEGCALRAEVDAGRLSPQRYRNFLKMRSELQSQRKGKRTGASTRHALERPTYHKTRR